MKLLACLVIVVSLCSCQSNLGYVDAELNSFDTLKGAVRLPYETEKGNQLAFYVEPREKGLPNPLIIVFPGIGSRALDRLDWVARCPSSTAGFLLIDYPGRGRCDGVLRPSRLGSTTEGAMTTLATYLRVDMMRLRQSIHCVGHSFGCAAALQFATQVPVNRIVLMAPFTTMKRALFRKMGPLAWLIPDNLDNRANLKILLSREDIPVIAIIHGMNDATIPLAMGKELKALGGETIRMYPIENGSHVSVLTENVDLMYQLLLKD